LPYLYGALGFPNTCYDSAEKILITAALAVIIGVLAYFLLPGALLGFAIARSAQEQTLQIEGARPLFDAVVRKKLTIGDSLEHAKKVLKDAGLEFTIDRDLAHPKLYSMCHAGRGPGFSIELELDSDDRIARIDIQDYVDVP